MSPSELYARWFLRPTFATEEEYQEINDYSDLIVYGGFMAAVHFIMLFVVLPKVLPRLVPKVAAMKPSARFHFTNEVACIAHHMLVVPIALYALYVQAATPLSQTPDMRFMTKAASLTCGYFAADLLICIPYFLKGQYLDFLVHHSLGILLAKMAVTNTFGARWVAWFLASELTTVIFTYSKYLMKTDQEDSVRYSISAGLFAVLFFILRVVLLPIACFYLAYGQPKDAALLGVARWSCPILVALQFWWFYRILVRVVPMVLGTAPPKSPIKKQP